MSVAKGYKQTEEHKRKRSEAQKRGSWFYCLVCGSKFWRRPFDIKNGDNKFCSKNCYFVWQKGRKRSEEFRKKCGKNKGEKNWNWKGGITPINKKIRGSVEFKEWRKKVFERDNYTCRECLAKSQKGITVYLHAHHEKPFASFPELRFSVDNGVTLCNKCHSKKAKGKDVWKLTK